MLAIILATGETEKLRPLTETMPSPMIPVIDRPVMAYVIELLARHGIKKIIVSLHYLANHIEAYFGNGQRWGVSIEYILQRDPWGTAGALKWAEHLLTETFLVMPADALIDVDVDAVLTQHRMRQSSATVVTHPHRGSGEPLCLDGNDRVVDIASTSTRSGQNYDTGVYVLEPTVLKNIPVRTYYDTRKQLVPSLLKAGLKVHDFQLQGFWNPLLSFQDLQLVQQNCLYSAQGKSKILNGGVPIRYPSVGGRQIASGIWVGPNNAIHPSARLAPPISIGENCRIGRDVELGPETVVGANVIVDDGATIRQSTIMEHTYIGQYVNIKNRIVDKNLLVNVVTEQNTRVADAFLLGEVQTSIFSNSLEQLFDALLALLILIITLPVTLLIALALWLVNGRAIAPVSRVHSRHDSYKLTPGSGLTTLSLLRFETRRSDNTYAAFGQILEKWGMNRLPELWNVVKRDLALVGVKPLSPDRAADVIEPWQKKRYEYSAGFTGLWYTQTTQNSTLDEILMADTYYVATRTWRNDIRLLWYTPVAWYKRHISR